MRGLHTASVVLQPWQSEDLVPVSEQSVSCVVMTRRNNALLSSHYSSTPILTQGGVNPDIWRPSQENLYFEKVCINVRCSFLGHLHA